MFKQSSKIRLGLESPPFMEQKYKYVNIFYAFYFFLSNTILLISQSYFDRFKIKPRHDL